jgi:hypothetical protein
MTPFEGELSLALGCGSENMFSPDCYGTGAIPTLQGLLKDLILDPRESESSLPSYRFYHD